MKRWLSSIGMNLMAWVLALVLMSIAVWWVGENPFHVLKVLLVSALGGVDNVTYTLFYATPMLLTGTAVALALEAGLFNIGAEGQLYIGALAVTVWGSFTRGWFAGSSSGILAFIVIVGGILFSFVGGAVWGGVAGYLRTRRQTHEVIATIMLNFIAMAIVNWAILNPLKNPDTQNLESIPLPAAVQLPRMWGNVTWGLPAALLVAATVLLVIKYTWWGFRVRATGKNEPAAKLAGIPVHETAFLAMVISGGIAGLVGFHEVFLHSYKLVDSFSPGFGFTGLAIALLARGSIPGLIFSAILFGALHKGTLDLDLETEKVTRDLSAVIQALILLALAVQPALASGVQKLKARLLKPRLKPGAATHPIGARPGGVE